jgi:DNA-binding XRE family transcriptional regulator
MTNKRTCKRCTVILDSTNNSRTCSDCHRETAKVRPNWIVEKSKIDDGARRREIAMIRDSIRPRPEVAQSSIYRGLVFQPDKMAIDCHAKHYEEGLSFKKIAKSAGVGQTTYQQIEWGRTRHPKPLTVAKICRALSLTMADYYGDTLPAYHYGGK